MASSSTEIEDNDSMNQFRRPQTWPYTSAISTGESTGTADTLLSAILAAGRLDEISTAADCVERYIRSFGHVDQNSGKLQSGVIFWVYPTGGKGPYEDLDDGSVLKHGLLLTAERGALLQQAVDRVRLALPKTGIAHEHVRAE